MKTAAQTASATQIQARPKLASPPIPVTLPARRDEWARELAPSSELRRWFGNEPAKFDVFRRRYRAELSRHDEKLRELRRRGRRGTLTLVYSARDTEHNDAVVLAELLRRRSR